MAHHRLLVLAAILLVSMLVLPAAEVKLEATYYFAGNMNGSNWLQPSIDVDADGTVAVGINRTLGAGNGATGLDDSSLVLLYDNAGEPTGQLASSRSNMVDVAFGPDSRVYTGEAWFASGAHLYDRPGVKPRNIPARFFNADGSHPDRGCPSGVAVGPDYRIYTISTTDGKLYITSPENKLLQTIDKPGHNKVDVTPDGAVYAGNKVLGTDGTWKEFKYFVRDTRADGKLLVNTPKGWGIYNPNADRMELEGSYPPGNWADVALGPDNKVYLTAANDKNLAYVVADVTGKIVLRRGADYDRLAVTLPGETLTAGTTVEIGIELQRSRALGLVPASQQLPADNRRPLQPSAFLAPVVIDPLGRPAWQSLKLQAAPEGRYQLIVPTGLHGKYLLKISTSASAAPPASTPLAVQHEMWIAPGDAQGYVTLATDRARTGFAPGEEVRITLSAASLRAGVPAIAGKFILTQQGKTIVALPVRFPATTPDSPATVALLLPKELTARLGGVTCQATLSGLPAGVSANRLVVAFGPAVVESTFETGFHGLGQNINMGLQAESAVLHHELGMSNIINPYPNFLSGNLPETYLDVATRLGLRYYHQPYSHFAPLNVLPNEDGAMRQRLATVAQLGAHYPAFSGFNYHDLFSPFGTWFDTRKDLYPPLFAEWAKQYIVPSTVPEATRERYLTSEAISRVLPRVYGQWGDAIRRADARDSRATMQWWHTSLAQADPRKVAKDQDIITTQHAEEQYYHPVTIANQVDLWRTPGKPLWCYGNATFMEDGSGASYAKDFMAALMRGVQGVGRDGWNDMPVPGQGGTEGALRTVTPAFRLLKAYGGLSAAAVPADQVAVWRSLYEEAQYGSEANEHLWATTAAYTACLYTHRTAAIVQDEDVLAGKLKNYQALIVSFAHPLPPALLAKVADFRKRGGLILANKPAGGYWAPEGAVPLGSLFTTSHADFQFNDDYPRHALLEAEEGGVDARKLKEALGDSVQPLVECDERAVWLSVLKSGDASYVWAANMKRLPQPVNDLHRYAAYENTVCPLQTTLRLQPGAYAIYDVFAGKRVTARPQRTELVLPVDMSVFPGALFALLPAPIDHVEISAGYWREQIQLLVEVQDARKARLNAAIPLEVTLTDGKAKVRYHCWRTAVEGQLSETFPLPLDFPGKWTITVTELLSGITQRAELNLTGAPVTIPAPRLAPAVEWFRRNEVVHALKAAKTVAFVTGEKQTTLAEPLQKLKAALAAKGKTVVEITAPFYLQERTTLHWDKLAVGGPYDKELQPRAKKFDLLVTCDLPGLPSGVIPDGVRPVEPSATDPGAGRGLIQYVAMPAYDTEDAIALTGGDQAGLTAAANALAGFAGMSEVEGLDGADVPPLLIPLPVVKSIQPVGLRRFIGTPAWEVCASADGARILAGMQGQGNTLITLDGDGKVLNALPGGKFYPAQLTALQNGFAVRTLENDATLNYLSLFDNNGRPTQRLAALGRCLQGTRDASATLTGPWQYGAFSITPDGRYAAVGGSKGVAVWNLQAGKLLWRDDGITYDHGGIPALQLSSDGEYLAVQYAGQLTLRDGQTGQVTGAIELPAGAAPGPVRLFDGRTLIMGGTEFFAYRGSRLQWRWKAPGEVSAVAFAADGLRWCVGAPDGTVKILQGGGQAAGYRLPTGGVRTLQMRADGSQIAFAGSTGWVGVLGADGKPRWTHNVNVKASIAFAGSGTVVATWAGRVTRYDAKGRELWSVDLTPRVYRNDLAAILTRPDSTPTLRVPAPKQPHLATPTTPNLALQATITYVPARSGGWRAPLNPQAGVGAVLNNGKADDIQKPWFGPYTCDRLMGSATADHPAWELAWNTPVTIDTLIIKESPAHPESVPEEISIQIWSEEAGLAAWKEVAHDYWTTGPTHTHTFPKVTTTKVRYIVHGDFGRNLWTTEIEAY